ncbi:hypothetical protein RB623_21550 [Mesorhizobium sp. LHD-90]|uniref:hypothetical protein n=1 Tax=Mesorhizobium sp. LHD-90 TaxID=3071414 RepID=UPI0027DF8192|nr:hypothetical protein [Mesorhizobium sp. LHD-90]MDQ6436643.1 hypothetical protein [Mesorhizobium sp. LHD-90]
MSEFDNTIVPVALANTADAELQAFRTYIEGDPGRYLISFVEAELDDLSSLLTNPFDVNAEAAPDVLGNIDGAIERADGIAANLRDIRNGYVDQLGITAALKEVVEALRQKITAPHVNALRYGLEVMQNDDRKIPRDLREGLHSLGMPKDNRRIGVLNTFRRAGCGSWMDQLKQPGSACAEEAA